MVAPFYPPYVNIVTALGKVYVPFTATSVSQAAAIAALDVIEDEPWRVTRLHEVHAAYADGLRAQGWDTMASAPDQVASHWSWGRPTTSKIGGQLKISSRSWRAMPMPPLPSSFSTR